MFTSAVVQRHQPYSKPPTYGLYVDKRWFCSNKSLSSWEMWFQMWLTRWTRQKGVDWSDILGLWPDDNVNVNMKLPKGLESINYPASIVVLPVIFLPLTEHIFNFEGLPVTNSQHSQIIKRAWRISFFRLLFCAATLADISCQSYFLPALSLLLSFSDSPLAAST